MAKAAMAQEQLVALRQTIARLEGDQVPALAAKARDASRGGFRPMAAQVRTGQLEGEGALLAIDNGPLDQALGGGLRLDGLSEIRSAWTADHGAATGFALGLAIRTLARNREIGLPAGRILWIGDTMAARESGLPHGRGLMQFGLEPHRLVHAAPRRIEEALMVAEAGLAVAAFSLIILEVEGNPTRFGLTESRRLHVRARAFGRPLVVLRQRGAEEASSALVRFGLSPAPSAHVRLPDGQIHAAGIGNPAFRISIEKSRHPVANDVLLEWNRHDHVFCPLRDHQPAGRSGNQPEDRFHPAAAPADGPDRAGALGQVVAFPRAS